MGYSRQYLWLHFKKITATFGNDPDGGANTIKEIRAKNVIKNNIKNGFIWLYYNYCEAYKQKPADIDDLCDGLVCLRVKNKIEKIYGETDG